MRLLIINSAEPNVSEFAENIKRHISSEEATCTIIDYAETLSFGLNEFDAIIISGSPQGDDIVEHHQPYFQWIKEFEKPVLGICAGHHVTAFMHGAKYLRRIEAESGKTKIQVIQDDLLFKNLPNPFTTYQMHNDSVTLPVGFIHLAKSHTCFNQAMKHEKKPLYTLQFHPEYFNPEVIRNFIDICKNRLL